MSDTETDRFEEFSRRFGEAVRTRRQALGMTLANLALATGVNRRFLSEMEHGKSRSELGRSLAVAHAVGLDLNSLYSPDTSPPVGATIHEDSIPAIDLEEDDVHAPGFF